MVFFFFSLISEQTDRDFSFSGDDTRLYELRLRNRFSGANFFFFFTVVFYGLPSLRLLYSPFPPGHERATKPTDLSAFFFTVFQWYPGNERDVAAPKSANSCGVVRGRVYDRKTATRLSRGFATALLSRLRDFRTFGENNGC